MFNTSPKTKIKVATVPYLATVTPIAASLLGIMPCMLKALVNNLAKLFSAPTIILVPASMTTKPINARTVPPMTSVNGLRNAIKPTKTTIPAMMEGWLSISTRNFIKKASLYVERRLFSKLKRSHFFLENRRTVPYPPVFRIA